jgi:Copper transport outer membrane protein, MctB
MLDLRYHVASLSAVFLALIVGILVGVGISGRGFVDKSERRNFENRITVLQSRVDQLGAQKSLLTEQGRADEAFAQQTYPALMHRRLEGRRIALIVVGSSGAAGDVEQALADAGAGVALFRVVKTPISAPAVRRAVAHAAGFRQLTNVGHELGQEWLTGGVTPISDSVSPLIVQEQRGAAGKPVDAAVVVQSSPADDAPTQKFLSGLFDGLTAGAQPVVAAERSNAQPSLVSAWRATGVSTVDDVDTPSGKLALALLIGGAPAGSFGVKATAEAPLPRIEPAP